MNYSVCVNAPFVEMLDTFKQEKLGGQRCDVVIKKDDDRLVFEVTAADSIALRATLNAITKLFTVCEKGNKL
ncbi:hypothetical protein COV93_01255 [Candidatus Woesearchaeota archaeon CG11_big_fil_rev_8_21_14_0_20_43_8]|nr:MAG: hypothetical protein COV93_01255 [Candidatus Woesearchaeota archaeon CG11_big_fil_rev_8_21_14_0_20_43_8]PIO04844.1 MAG: hypothetical protein COT47_07245 [Candidatus Woesearchaeota archaeon CG08_land_8_20_14_0_20_43_7]